jgi:oligosaccharide reducing-end xylanase
MQREFDKLWNFAKTHMQHQSGPYTGYFAWQVRTNGAHIDPNPAPDGDEYFAMALLMAANRWGNGTGIYDYEAEANSILDHMLNHEALTGNAGVPSLINGSSNQIIFTTEGMVAHTNPSYHLPHFYELFARWAQKDSDRWRTIAQTSRQLFKDACHPSTGLAPDYCQFDGTPTGGEHAVFRFDAWRVAMNIALDSYWWNTDPWARDTWVGNYLEFFHGQGVDTHLNQFNLDGSGAQGDHSPGLVAMNATAALISDDDIAWDFVNAFWRTSPTTGQYRYYDGCLYLFGLLNVTGRFQIIGN